MAKQKTPHLPEKLENSLPELFLLLATTVLLGLATLVGIPILKKMLEEGFNSVSLNWLEWLLLTGIFYILGWASALLAVRRYKNKYALIITKIYTWAWLLGILVLYVTIINNFYPHDDAVLRRLFKFIVFALFMGGALVGLIGLSLIPPEDGDMKIFGWFLLVECLAHLVVISIRYVLYSDSADPYMLGFDLLFAALMSTYALLAIAHKGLLQPIRDELNKRFP